LVEADCAREGPPDRKDSVETRRTTPAMPGGYEAVRLSTTMCRPLRWSGPRAGGWQCSTKWSHALNLGPLGEGEGEEPKPTSEGAAAIVSDTTKNVQ